MINHIVMWSFKKELSKEKKAEAAGEIKRQLEAVAAAAEGVISLKVIINEMDSSNMDIMLVSAFESREALDAYQGCPAHVKAKEYIGSVVEKRSCMDYREQ